MRFVVDECTGPAVARYLMGLGHDVVSVFDAARGVDDDRVLQLAVELRSILITNDKDFGERVFSAGNPHHGVILLRLADERHTAKVKAVRELLAAYADQLPGRFVVVSERAVRFASPGRGHA
ncbi:MAG: hypothetical protein C0506_05045 [Anaerolinea sp.]|nr:hypothetical protein [Anaerolinea sp.]